MSDYPYNYELQNQSSIKSLNVVVKFEGTDIQFSLIATYKKLRYGEDDIRYGDPGLVYGGLIPIAGVKPILSPNSNLIISQKIEPEQGRGSAGTFSLEFVDKDGFMTAFVTPGQTLNEVLGGKLVRIFLGYQNTSYPEDYFSVFRGYVSSVMSMPTKIVLQLTDANLKRRQQCFYLGKSVVYSAIKEFQTTAVNTATSTFTVPGHGFSKDVRVTVGSTQALPTPLVFGNEYFVKNPTASTFQLSQTWDGPVIPITSVGAGTLQVKPTKIVGNVGYQFDPTAVDTSLNKITLPNHGFTDNMRVNFESAGVLPGGIQIGINYFVTVLTPDQFQVKLTAVSVSPVDLTTQGAGQQFIYLSDAPSSSVKIPMAKTNGFAVPILGPSGRFDESLKTYLKINDEFMEYQAAGVAADGITVSRGSRGSVLKEIKFGDAVDNVVEMTGNPIDLALKVMLSGWAGPCFTDVPVFSFNETGLNFPRNFPNAIVLSEKANAVEDYGIADGDYLTITGSTSNNKTFTVKSFGELNGYPNRVIFVNETVVTERPSSGKMAVRSQYDTFPKVCGTKLKTYDVDVARWQTTKLDFLFQSDNTMRILQDAPIPSKDFIESELLLPCGAYSVTRFGRLSVTITKPPIVDGRSIYLDQSNIVEPQNISVTRAVNQRAFFNEVQYQYNSDSTGTFRQTLSKLDTNSLNAFDVSSVLPIKSRGLHSDLGAEKFIDRRGLFILRRYKDAATIIKMKTNWQAASLIEVGDVIPVYDNGTLHIANFQDGTRDIGSKLFEVWERSLDMKTGTANLTLATQIGYEIDDRFATISPSSKVDSGSTTSSIRIKDSFQGLYPGNEKRKFEGLEGQTVWFHSTDCTTFSQYKTFLGFDPGDPYLMLIDPPFASPPPVGTIIDIDLYSEDTPGHGQKYKIAFAHFDPTLTVTQVNSDGSFQVSGLDATKLSGNQSVLFHNSDWSRVSDEAKIDQVVGNQFTLKAHIDFVPAVGDLIELVGFKDGGGAYRII